ncbi:MAG: hypothetical protein GSR80_000074 [Desulfurococcales archaeon]|nr:hypothetical protein [Desulfurococcales archaeon]
MSRWSPRRIYVLPIGVDIQTMAAFIVNSLLVSHGIRPDAAAFLRLRRGWLWVPGSGIRHLRPDADSSEGWVRAVLRGRSLGARIVGDPAELQILPEGALCIETVADVGATLCRGSLAGARHVVVTYVWASKSWGEPPLPIECLERCQLKLATPLALSPAVVNIILDRVEAGLDHLLPTAPRVGVA